MRRRVHERFSGQLPDAGVATDPVPWSRPWMEPWCAAGQSTTHAMAQGLPLPLALNRCAPAPVRFVPQSDLPAGVAYEQFIADTACCPVRDGWHDFFNGLCWHLFPVTKHRLNHLQAAHILQDGIGPTRGAVRDTLTVFDENAALLQTPDALWDALAEKNWRRVFIDLRPSWRLSRLVLFGHALLEKLLVPRKSITAHVLRVPDGLGALADWDGWLSSALTPEALTDRPYVHLPVLGVPGWWAGNEDPNFYDDAQVFRPPRARMRTAQ